MNELAGATPIRLIVADDHKLFRQGLKALIQLHPELEIVAEAETSAALHQVLATTACDVLLLDLQMEHWMLAEVEQLKSLTKVVVLTASERVEDAMAALRLGARAIVHKRFAIETLAEAIRAVAGGLVWMAPELQTELTAQWSSAPASRLTAREEEIVRYVAGGMRNSEVAQRLTISEGTVKTHLNNIFHKLGLRDRVGLTHYALRSGLVAVRDRPGGSDA